MVEIIFPEGHKEWNCAVYKVEFSNGFFYLGASLNTWDRIQQHATSIRRNFISEYCPVAMRQMKGFCGSVTFSIVEAIGSCESRGEAHLMVRDAEHKHIIANKDNPSCLNTIRSAYKKRPNLRHFSCGK
jgi:predicted GIY-YIG superfamily endonuclease